MSWYPVPIPPQAGRSVLVTGANSGIGIYQEWRAKQALDRLAALVAPHATVIRDGVARRVPVEEVVEVETLPTHYLLKIHQHQHQCSEVVEQV